MAVSRSSEKELDLEICLDLDEEGVKSAAKKRSTKQNTESSIEIVGSRGCIGSQPFEVTLNPQQNQHRSRFQSTVKDDELAL